MKLAPITAPQWAFKFQKGDCHMVYAPWLFEVPNMAQFYMQSARDTDTLVIVNHGNNLGYRLGVADLGRATAMCRANEVVLPDLEMAPKETLQEAWKAAQMLSTSLVPQDTMSLSEGQLEMPITAEMRVGPDSMMFVPQARNTDDWKRCLEAWANVWEQSGLSQQLTIGIVSNTAVPRKELILAAHQYPYAIHLLGMPDLQTFIREEMPVGVGCAVRSVDTSTPFALGARGWMLTPRSKATPLDKPLHYARLSHWNMRLVDLNIRIMRHWLGEGQATHYVPITEARIVASQWKATREAFEKPAVALRLAGCPPGEYELTSEGFRPLARGEKPARGAERLGVSR